MLCSWGQPERNFAQKLWFSVILFTLQKKSSSVVLLRNSHVVLALDDTWLRSATRCHCCSSTKKFQTADKKERWRNWFLCSRSDVRNMFSFPLSGRALAKNECLRKKKKKTRFQFKLTYMHVQNGAFRLLLFSWAYSALLNLHWPDKRVRLPVFSVKSIKILSKSYVQFCVQMKKKLGLVFQSGKTTQPCLFSSSKQL